MQAAQNKKKIKGQIPGVHYSWLVGISAKRKCSVSDVLAEIVNWISSDDRILPDAIVDGCKSANGSHTYLNFNADKRLLAKWEMFKRRNKIKGDSHAIRVAVYYRYGLSIVSNQKAPTRNGKPIQQKNLF